MPNHCGPAVGARAAAASARLGPRTCGARRPPPAARSTVAARARWTDAGGGGGGATAAAPVAGAAEEGASAAARPPRVANPINVGAACEDAARSGMPSMSRSTSRRPDAAMPAATGAASAAAGCVAPRWPVSDCCNVDANDDRAIARTAARTASCLAFFASTSGAGVASDPTGSAPPAFSSANTAGGIAEAAVTRATAANASSRALGAPHRSMRPSVGGGNAGALKAATGGASASAEAADGAVDRRGADRFGMIRSVVNF